MARWGEVKSHHSREKLPHPDPIGSGQESVWRYPRPPALVADARLVEVEFAGVRVACTDAALRCLETANPPCFYLPPGQVRMDLLTPAEPTSFCEWKGHASYWDLRVEDQVSFGAAWSYRDPAPEYAALRDYVAFFAGRVDCCRVGEVAVTPQSGNTYGGWITPELVGPFKGEPGSEWW